MEPIDYIKQNFQFLIDEYNFTIIKEVIYPDPYICTIVIYNSKNVQVYISIDKGQVLIEMGKSNSLRNELHDFSYIIQYFNPMINNVYIPSEELKGGKLGSSIDFQSKSLSEMMRENCTQIFIAGFTPEIENQIKEFKKQYVEWLLSDLKQKPKFG